MAPITLASLLTAGSAANPGYTAYFTSDDEPATVTSKLFTAFGANLSGGTSLDTYAPSINDLAASIVVMLSQNSISDEGDENPAAVYVTTAGTNYSLALVLSEVKAGGAVEFNLPAGLAISGASNSTGDGLNHPYSKRDVKVLNKQYAKINFALNSYGTVIITPSASDASNGTVGATKYPAIKFSPKTLPATGVWNAVLGASGVGTGVVGGKGNAGY